MKNLIITLVLVIVSISVSAQVEVYGRYTSGGNVQPNINFFGVKKISDKLNLTYFALVEETWSEALVGVAYSPKKWLELGLSTGIEHNPAILRFGGSIWIGKGKTSFLTLLEQGKGKDNYWYKISLTRNLSETVSLGAMAWRFHGLGPIVKYTPKKSDLTFWTLPAYDPEFKAKRLMVGVSIKI